MDNGKYNGLYCRGHEKRVELVKKYNIKPIIHLPLLNGKVKKSDVEAKIENEYYLFELTPRYGIGKSYVITCGMGVARDFLNLINHKGLPIFNPFISDDIIKVNSNSEKMTGKNVRVIKKNVMMLQLLNAINWIILLIEPKPDTAIYDIKREIEPCIDKEPFLSKIKGVNTIIRKSFGGRSLIEKINEIKNTNKINQKFCNFNLLTEKLNENEVESFFC